MLVYLLIAYHFKMLIAPAHAIALAAPPDAAQNTVQFTYFQDIFLLAPDAAHPINSCFKKYGFDIVHDLVAMTTKDVEGLKYDKFDGAGALANTLDVPCGYKFMIRAFISMFYKPSAPNRLSARKSSSIVCRLIEKPATLLIVKTKPLGILYPLLPKQRFSTVLSSKEKNVP
jgi:hypothetical protein